MLTWIWTFLFLACSGTSPETSNTKTSQAPSTQEATTAAEDASVEGETSGTMQVDGSLLERHKKLGSDPAETVALWLEAAIRAQNNEQEGWDALQFMTIPLKDDQNWVKSSGNVFFVERIQKKNPSFRSFIVGATPENGYKVDMSNIRISVAYEGKRDVRGRKLMINSSGATMPRPIYLLQSDQSGLYYVKEYSSMYVDVRPPIDPSKETFH